MNMNKSKELSFTIDTAKQAGEILTDYHGGNLKQKIKSHPQDIVTEADEKAEELIIQAVQEKYPHDNIIAEESGRIGAKQADFTWLIDPLDGTWNFSQKNNNYGVMIACANQKEVIVSVIWCPGLNILVTSQKGKGATLDDKKVKVPTITDPKKLRDILSIAKPGNDTESFKELQTLFQQRKIETSYGSAAINTINALQGKFDIRLSTPPGKIWDHGPTSLPLAEAGLKVTNFRGEKYRWNRDTEGYIAAPVEHHETIMKKMLK